MKISVDQARHLVTLHGDQGSKIVLNWASALNLGSLLIEKAHEAEPPAVPGKRYEPKAARW